MTPDEQAQIDEMKQGLNEVREIFDEMSSNLNIIFPMLDNLTPEVRSEFLKLFDDLVTMIRACGDTVEAAVIQARKKYETK